jgi:hypothetical protein
VWIRGLPCAGTLCTHTTLPMWMGRLGTRDLSLSLVSRRAHTKGILNITTDARSDLSLGTSKLSVGSEIGRRCPVHGSHRDG